MPKTAYKKPTIEEFTAVINKTGGHIANAAALLGVNRATVAVWCKDDEQFAAVLKDSRKKILDDCIFTARVLAAGVAIKDEEGKFIGWQERPDSQMVRYLLQTLGKDEGFGDSLDITTNGKDINQTLFRTLTKDEIQHFDETFESDY